MIHHGRMFTLWKIIKLLLWVLFSSSLPPSLWLVSPHLPPSTCSFFPTHFVNYVHTINFLRFILIFLLSFCFYFLRSLLFSKACIRDVKLCYHVSFLLLIQLHINNWSSFNTTESSSP